MAANGELVFNNWRIMHGRSAFDGVRRICGAYSRCPRRDDLHMFSLTLGK